MKKQRGLLIVTAIVAALLWSCTKVDLPPALTLKQSVNQNTANLNSAVASMASSQAYGILTVTNATSKSLGLSAETYKVYITLDTVKGVFDYKPVEHRDRWNWSLYRFFTKTATSDQMIVNMPLSLVQHPRQLWRFDPADTTMKNDFQIAVSGYHNDYNSYWDFDYLLNSKITIDNAVAGQLNINYVKNPTTGIAYASDYAFTDSITAAYKYQSGDTINSSFTISKNGTVLYEEQRLSIKTDTALFGREHQYILTIGDVEIVRSKGLSSAVVYLNGVKQTKATVTVTDGDDDPEGSVCEKREVTITFDDGTTKTISDLISASVSNIKTIFNSLHSVYFAAEVVDNIAYDIYYNRK
jgi:hypothetical protein